jgi:hypothetical protein
MMPSVFDHPSGLLVTIRFSLWTAFRSSASFTNFLWGGWELFTAYLLPWVQSRAGSGFVRILITHQENG